MKNVNEEHYKEIKEWYSRLQATELDETQIGISAYIPNEEDDAFMDVVKGISGRGVDRVQRNTLKVVCKKGDLIIPQDDGGKFLGIVYKGSVLVKNSVKTLATLHKGDLFGELSLITGTYRSASVLAESDQTEVLILSKTALNMPSLEDEVTIDERGNPQTG